VQLSAATSILRRPSSTSVFVVCQDCRTAGPFTLVRVARSFWP
jgi:hypothetical protein